MPRIIKWIGASLVFFACLSSLQAMEPGMYFGLQVGQSNTNNKAATIQTGTTPATETVTPENTGVAERILIGYQFNAYGAFEMGYSHYTPSTYSPTVPTNLVNTPQIRENGVDMIGKLIWQVAKGPFSVFGKAGVTVLRVSKSGSLKPPNQRESSTTSVRPTLGVGASYDITQSWQTDISMTTVMSGGGVKNVNFFALGLTYHFVDYFCGQFLC